MSPDTYIGIGLALLASNLCLLLLVINALSWINFLHMDLTPVYDFAESTLPQRQLHFQTATIGWLVIILLRNIIFSAKPTEDESDSNNKKQEKYRRSWQHTALVIVSVVSTLALPHLLTPYRQSHPVIRRSLIGNFSAAISEQPPSQTAPGEDQPAIIIEQELVFTVDKMTCGGCGSHVSNLAESNLARQQKTSSSPFTINKVQVDWRAGVMSIYGTHVTEYVDRQSVAATLEEDGYPTSFLYSQ